MPGLAEKLGTLYDYLLPYRRRLIQAVVLAVVVTLIGLLPPLVIKVIVDHLLVGGITWLFWPMVIALAAVPIINQLVGKAFRLLTQNTAAKLTFDVRFGLYRHVTALPLGYFDKHSTGMVLERLMGDVNKFQQLVTGQVLTLATDVVMATFSIYVMLAINWHLALVLLAVVPLYVLNHRFFVRRIRASNEQFRAKMDDVSGHLEERLTGTALVKSYGMERTETRNFTVETHAALQHSSRARGLMVAFSNTAELVHWAGYRGIFLLGCYLVIDGGMSYGDVLAFTSYAMFLLGPAVRFSQLVNQIEQTMVSVRRVKELLGEQPEPDRGWVVNHPDASFRGRVQLDKVSFAYEPDNPVLKEVSLDVPAGKTVALVGRTGCGKTTLTSLLYRFYRPTHGRILLDGHDIAELDLGTLRKQLAVVPQDAVLFEGTAAENIAYGRSNATREQIVAAAKLAEIHDVLENLPNGYDTPLGQAGAKLSGGQKQRLVIARAVLVDPVVLILDEATSSLDTESERLIQRALRKVMRNRTCFVIAHRLSTIQHADLIVVMDEGHILETGTHAELLARPDSHYGNMYRRQFARIGRDKEQAAAVA